jgi:hypothetical protein
MNYFRWLNQWNGPSKATHYVSSVVKNLNQIQALLVYDSGDEIFQNGISLQDVFFPDAILVAFWQLMSENC